MQQVAARNCLHGAASGTRDGVSVLHELFWNAAARSDAICSEFSFGSVLLHGFARVCDARATDWDASRVIHGRTLLCTAVNYADPILQRVLSAFGCFAARARLKLTSKVGVPYSSCVF